VKTVLFFALCMLLPAAFNCAAARQGDSPPNIVLIVADDLGYGELGCYGQQHIKTPHIDALAKAGMRFTDFYCGAPVCAPSRCVLMTGRHLGHASVQDNGNKLDKRTAARLKQEFGWEFPGQNPLPDNDVTIAELLKQRGYATAAIGKWGLGHFGTTGDPNRQGFDLFFGYNCQYHAHNHYPAFLWRNTEKVRYPGNDGKSLAGAVYSQDEFTREALQFIQQHKDEPFFLFLPVVIPHLSIQVPDESLAQYTSELPEAPYKHNAYLQHPQPRAGYAAMVSHLDRDVGRVVALIEQLGLADDTLIIFTSDNGPTYERLGGADSDFFESSAGLRGRKGSVYEGGIRVPLVARWDGRIAADSVSEVASAFWDVMPTLCEVASAATPGGIDGVSLWPTLSGRASDQSSHEFLVWDFPGYGGQRAVRIGKWKGVIQNRAKGNTAVELYDLQSDRGEQHNVADQHPEVVAQINAILERECNGRAGR
jgi:arylsulfatase